MTYTIDHYKLIRNRFMISKPTSTNYTFKKQIISNATKIRKIKLHLEQKVRKIIMELKDVHDA